MKYKTLSAVVISCIAFMLAGCLPTAKPDDPEFAPVKPIIPSATQVASTGAIYQAGFDHRLYEDYRAHKVGDIITVTLTETTTATKKAETKTSKETTIEMPNPTVLGSSPQSTLANGFKNTLDTTVDNTRDFSGKGESKQNNSLQGSITVSVYDVLSNGNLMVRGEKWISLNRGDEYIRLKGIIRPQDILPDNSVPSTKVADVRITYSGSGEVADSNVAGWMGRFFSSMLWPF